MVPAARTGAFLDELEELDVPLLVDLELRRFGGVHRLASMAAAARLRALRLVNPTAAAMSALGLVTLPSLRELEIRTVFEDDEPPLVNARYLAGVLAALGGLHRLTLGGGAFEPPGLAQVARAGLPDLVSLSLSDEDLTAADVAALAAAPGWAGLVELELSRCRLGDDGAELVARAAPPGLVRLVVDGNGIGPRGARALARLRGLRELHLSGNPLGDGGLAELAAGLPDLRILHLAEAQVGPTGAAALAHAAFTPALVELDLGDNPLGERGGAALPALPGLCALTLAGTQIADAFVTLVAERVPALRALDVSRCGLDAPALAALRGRNLLELRLGHNELGDDAVEAVAGLGLQLLELANTGLGPEGATRLLADPRFASLRTLDLTQNRLPAALVERASARRAPRG